MEVNATMYGNPGNPYQQQPMDYYNNPYMQNPYFQSQPMTYNQQMQVPNNQNALTNEEIQRLRAARPTGNLNLTIEPEEVLRAMCTHKENGIDKVQIVQDGSGDVWCPICQKRWSPEQLSQEEVQALTDKFVAQLQNIKWAADLPLNVTREYMSMIPMVEKMPDIYKYGMRNFNKYMSQNGMYSAQDANIYSMYNGLFNGGGYGYNPQMYNNPYQQPMGYYNQQVGQAQQAVGQVANPGVNPMQQPMYGAPGYNPQFGNQANMMMGGTYYQQPGQGQPQQMYNPVFTNPQVNNQQTGQPVVDQSQQQTKTDIKTDL